MYAARSVVVADADADGIVVAYFKSRQHIELTVDVEESSSERDRITTEKAAVTETCLQFKTALGSSCHQPAILDKYWQGQLDPDTENAPLTQRYPVLAPHRHQNHS